MAKRLFVDMDGTLARFHDQVNYLERMWEPGFFRNLDPFDNMLYGIKDFIKQHPDTEVFILSSKILGEPPYCEMEKNAWLDVYLPEVDKAHRIFPPVGTPKHQSIAGGITKNDFLLDDYNKSLREWEAAGGSAVKCHNNVNQRGLGAYGGDRGQIWEGAMVHTRDRPEMIAAELAQHMGMPYDLNSVLKAYQVQQIFSPATVLLDNMRYAMREIPDGVWRTYGAKMSDGVFANPLNAVRSVAGDLGYDEVSFRDMGGNDVRATKYHIYDAAMNAGFDEATIPGFSAPELDWYALGCAVSKKLDGARSAPQSSTTAIQRAAREAVALYADAYSVESAEDYETLRQQAERDAALDAEELEAE